MPTEEPKVIGYDTTFSDVSDSFSDWIPAEAVVIYSDFKGQEEPRPTPLQSIIVTSSLNSGPGSLRWAIANLQAGGMISFSDDVHLIPLTSGALVITKTITINGPGSDQLVVNGLKRDRVFDIEPGAEVVINGLTIADGLAHQLTYWPSLSYTVWRSEPEGGGGIRNTGILTITNSVLRGNEADYGGAIHNDGDGRVTVSNSMFVSNAAVSQGGGIYNSDNGTITVNRSTFSGNRTMNDAPPGGGGGALYNANNTILNNVTFSGNIANGRGGAMYNSGNSDLTSVTFKDNLSYVGGGMYNTGPLTIASTVFAGNSAQPPSSRTPTTGGGMYTDEGKVVLTNVTFSDNDVFGFGGGMYVAGGNVTLINNTLAGNTARKTPFQGSDGGGLYNQNGAVDLDNSIVANNTPNDCWGAIASSGYNLLGNVTGCSFNPKDSDLVGNSTNPVDPRLGSLENNGGRTQTHALLPDSPAIDVISPTVCSNVTTDQRGVSRPQGPKCDIGAYEVIEDVAIADVGEVITATTAPTVGGEAGASITLTNNTAGSGLVTATVATYATNPTTANIIAVGGGYIDLHVANADPGDQLEAKIYYPSTITGITETNLVLQYFTGSGWQAVRSSGDTDPMKDMTDDLDDTISGGRFLVTFDISSTPPITGLTGTVFAFTTNTAPTVELGDDVTLNEGDALTRIGTFSDSDSSSWTATVDYGDGLDVQPLTLNPDKTFALSRVYADNGSHTVTVTVTDNAGGAGSDTLILKVNNVAPTVGTINAPTKPVKVNTAISASSTFTDLGLLDTHTAVWDWGDGSTSPGVVTETSGSGSVSGSHSYAAADIYTITLTVTDKDSASGQAVIQPVVIFNPSAGFVTGGGWVKDGGTLAPFGLAAKYVGQRDTLSGEVLYAYRSGAKFVRVKSQSIQWLVITVNTAILRGKAKVDGVGNYTFEITAIDNGHQGTRDTFAIKIWRPDGTLLHALPATRLSGGDISVHKGH